MLVLLLCRDLIPVEWIRLFNPQELQRLIGGEGGRAIDVEDLKRNTLYAGGYHQSQPVMQVCDWLAWALVVTGSIATAGLFVRVLVVVVIAMVPVCKTSRVCVLNQPCGSIGAWHVVCSCLTLRG